MTNRALFDIDDDGEDQFFIADHSEELEITLRVPSTASSWMLQVWDPDHYDADELITGNPPRASKSAPLLELVGTTTGQLVSSGAPSSTVTVTMPASGTHSWVVRSIVDGGFTNGSLDSSKVWSRGLIVKDGTVRKPVVTETQEFEDDSWAGLICDLVDAIGKSYRGSGSPEGVVTASIGSTYQRTNGGAGTSFYVKESGTGNTGWVAK